MKDKYTIAIIAIMGLISGILLSLSYINPIDSTISVEDIIFQLSGSRGNILLGLSFTELLSFSARLLPYFAFELYMGVKMYQHFCTASIYVFSRVNNRISWYCKETLQILLENFIFTIAILISAIIITHFRYCIVISASSIYVFIAYLLLYSMWSFSMTMLINLIALKVGSSTAFFAITTTQILCITTFGLIKIASYNYSIVHIFLLFNPMTRLVLGWQAPLGCISGYALFDEALYNAKTPIFFSFSTSIGLYLLLLIFIIGLGWLITNHYEIFYSNAEEEV